MYNVDIGNHDSSLSQLKMLSMEDCTHVESPNVTYLLSHLSLPQTVGVCFEGFACVLLILLFFNDWAYFYKRLEDPTRFRSVLLIQLTYVIYAISSFLTIVSPRSSTLTELVFTVYFSFTLKELLTLMIHYLGGEHHAIANTGGLLATLAVTPFACFCGRCCPKVYINKRFLLYIKIAVYQTAVFHPILDFFSAMLWSNGLYNDGQISPEQTSFYFLILEKLSILFAFYALTVLFWSMRDVLNRHHIAGKFVCIQITMILSGFQETVFNTFARFGLISCKGILNATDRSTMFHHYTVVAEMLILYVISSYFHSLEELKEDEEHTPVVENKNDNVSDENEPLLRSIETGYNSIAGSNESISNV